VLQEAYARDKVLQDELQELAEQRSLYSVYTDLIAFWEHVLNMSELCKTQTIVFFAVVTLLSAHRRKVQASPRASAASAASASGRRFAARASQAGDV
jgi:hypothetical protein